MATLRQHHGGRAVLPALYHEARHYPGTGDDRSSHRWEIRPKPIDAGFLILGASIEDVEILDLALLSDIL